MEFSATSIPDVLVVTPKVFGDDRGFFMETWQARRFAEAGIDIAFVQDNHSRSRRGTLRGIHYQIQHPQGKLVRVTSGAVFDVAVDLRRSSPTFGQWVGEMLTGDNHRQLWVPPGFGHGFLVLSEYADFTYKCTDYYAPDYERSLLWNDPAIGIEWPLSDIGEPLLSEKDQAGDNWSTAEFYS